MNDRKPQSRDTKTSTQPMTALSILQRKLARPVGTCLLGLTCVVVIPLPVAEAADSSSAIATLTRMFTSEKKHQPAEIAEIVEKTGETKEEVKSLTDEFVIEQIEKYNELINAIKTDVASKSFYLFEKNDRDKYRLIHEGVGEIRDFLQEILEKGRNEKVREELRTHIERISTFCADIPVRIEQERQREAQLEAQRTEIDTLPEARRPVRLKSLERRISFSKKRQEMLTQFSANYDRIKIVLDQAAQTIDQFFFVVQESALVYADAYETLQLGQDITAAYQTMEEFRSLDTISKDILQSWQDLDTIVATLTAQVNQFS